MPTLNVQGIVRKLKTYVAPVPSDRRVLGVSQQLPPHVSLRSFQSPVMDQSVHNDCTAHAWCAAAEYLHIRDAGGDVTKFTRLSRFALYYATRVLVYHGSPQSDDGALNNDVAEAFETYGTCSADLWPDDDAHFAVPPSVEAATDGLARRAVLAFSLPTLHHIKASIAGGFPAVVGTGIPWSMEHDPEVARTGKIPAPSPSDPIAGLHDMLIVGYDDIDQVVEVKNSWGNGWGNGGYGTLPYSCFGATQDDLLIECVANEAMTLRWTEDEK